MEVGKQIPANMVSVDVVQDSTSTARMLPVDAADDSLSRNSILKVPPPQGVVVVGTGNASHILPTTPSTLTSSANEDPQYLEWKTSQALEAQYKSDKKLVTAFVKDHLFSKVKFITTDEELVWKGIYW